VPRSQPRLTVAVTGPTGTFGFGLMPLLEVEPRIARVAGIARRPFDPGAHGWRKLAYRQGDVRDPGALEAAFRGADVVVHLAFLITGNASRATIRETNVTGTLNAYRAAKAVGARRFVYASSVAAYGFHPDNPVPMSEEWPVRPAHRLFYAREKAEIERALREEAALRPGVELYVLRPSAVVGPHAVGAKDVLPGPLAPLGRRLASQGGRLPVPLPALVPALPFQLVHEDDVGQALLACVLGAGPPGAYNIAADDVLTATDVARELGFVALPLPAEPVQAAARALAALPGALFQPPATEWVEAAAQPAIMDTAKARRELGWSPRFTGREALRDTLRRGP
jgi:nucleoside-diphosphate-sugar epimerase